MRFIALKNFPLVKLGDDVGELVCSTAEKNEVSLEEGDVVVVAQSIVSKAEGAVKDLRRVNPSRRAKRIAKRLEKDPREVEVSLEQSKEVVRLGHVLISRTKHGFVCANAGVDHSNAEPDHVTVLPEDPDVSAKKIMNTIREKTGCRVAVLISDTQGRPFRRGCVGFSIGAAGINPLMSLKGRRDLYGKKLKSTVICPADAIAAGAVLLMGEADEGTPVVVAKGACYKMGAGNARDIVMSREEDLFR
jgi:coenzyme F420-0:L-glutamate ligase/coenzyme F420-1:gamma-L-glutamate ligase